MTDGHDEGGEEQGGEDKRGRERYRHHRMRGEKTEGREVREAAGLQREHSTRMVTKTTD
jgi:hypothetical protein